MMSLLLQLFTVLLSVCKTSHAFLHPPPTIISQRHTTALSSSSTSSSSSSSVRRAALTLLSTLPLLPILPSSATADDTAASVESITERAARLSREAKPKQTGISTPVSTTTTSRDSRTAYDFTVLSSGADVPFAEFIGQEFPSPDSDGVVSGDPKVKAVVVVNIKQDDPIARKDISELLELTKKYGQDGLVVVCIPTDQGYYEPDTSVMVRLKLAAEYNYVGTGPYTKLTDKMNLLGTGAQPFTRWIQGECRTPAGLGKIQANFEKFLVDGRTGRPLRRYPRKYDPVLMISDIEALLKNKSLPPPSGNYFEEWRGAEKDMEVDLFRFQKGLNYFDQ